MSTWPTITTPDQKNLLVVGEICSSLLTDVLHEATTQISHSFLASVQRWSHSTLFINFMAMAEKVPGFEDKSPKKKHS